MTEIIKLGQDRQALALAALCWVCNAKRPLDMVELQHAIASMEEAPKYTVYSRESRTYNSYSNIISRPSYIFKVYSYC